jgi:hypothetical protein
MRFIAPRPLDGADTLVRAGHKCKPEDAWSSLVLLLVIVIEKVEHEHDYEDERKGIREMSVKIDAICVLFPATPRP